MITENDTPGWDILAEVALARRNRLGLTQRNVAEGGGPSAPTVRALETQSSAMTPRSLHRLEAALGWKHGTTQALINGLKHENQDQWENFVSSCVHNPPVPPDSDVPPEIKKNLEYLISATSEYSFGEDSEKRDRYEQLDISLSHATYLLSRLKSAQEDGDDAAFRERFTSLHHLIRSMHYSVMQELAP